MEEPQPEPQPQPKSQPRPEPQLPQPQTVELDPETASLCSQITARLNQLSKELQNNPKINKYLGRVFLSSQQMLASIQGIVDSMQHLRQNAVKHPFMGRSVKAVLQYIRYFLQQHDIQKMDSKQKTVWVLEVESKLSKIGLMNDRPKPGPDVTTAPKQDYQKVWDRITLRHPDYPLRLKKDYKVMQKLMHMTVSAILDEENHDFALVKKCVFGLSYPRYFMMSDSCKLRSYIYYREPELQMAQNIWNTLEKGAISQVAKVVLYEGVKTNDKIYLPPDGELEDGADIFSKKEECVPVRVLYSKKLHYFAGPNQSSSKKESPAMLEKVLIHMHGGGFIALSSRSMQSITRRWANELEVPILSIDYRMAPGYPFPTPGYDCLAVYKFVVNHIHKYMNIKPTEIYLTGDSAGGNLSCVLTGLVLREKLPAPKGLYLVYPATDLRLRFTESRVYSITDVLIWPSTLMLCFKAYLCGDEAKGNDPLASPVLFSQSNVNGKQGDDRFPLNWPRTIMTCGTRDPLLDDTLLLMQRMVESGVDCECYLYDQFSHGYLNIGDVVKDCQTILDESLDHLSNLMGVSKKSKV